ncbi:MAG: universal stress protein [Gammaproteobacteria bacterium]
MTGEDWSPGPVLVVMDASDAAGSALDRGRRLAGATGARLELFSCEFDQAMEGSHFRVTDRLQQARDALVHRRREELEAQAGPLREAGVDVSTDVIYCNPRYEAIVRKAVQCGAGMVVVPTHHHAWLDRAALTATEWHLIRTCPVPLLLAKARSWPSSPRWLAAVDPSHVDDRHARLDGAVAHCYLSMASLESAAAFPMMPEALGSSAEDYAGDLVHQRRAAVLRVMEDRSLPAASLRLAEGRPEEELPRLVEDMEIDVLVTGAVSRSRLEQVFIGGTAERLLDRVSCDLLVVQPPGFRTPVPA